MVRFMKKKKKDIKKIFESNYFILFKLFIYTIIFVIIWSNSAGLLHEGESYLGSTGYGGIVSSQEYLANKTNSAIAIITISISLILYNIAVVKIIFDLDKLKKGFKYLVLAIFQIEAILFFFINLFALNIGGGNSLFSSLQIENKHIDKMRDLITIIPPLIPFVIILFMIIRYVVRELKKRKDNNKI